MNQKTDKKLQQLKSGNLTDLEFGKYLDSFLLQTASRNFRSVQATTDPRFIWPESVRRVTTEWAAAEMESAAASREFVKYGGFTAAVKARETLPKLSELGGGAEQRASDKASTIRAILRLPERGEACKNGKRSLTLEQIKKLQGA